MTLAFDKFVKERQHAFPALPDFCIVTGALATFSGAVVKELGLSPSNLSEALVVFENTPWRSESTRA